MKVEEIERLLAEFLWGNTTESQEAVEVFRTTEVPEHLQKDKEIFLSLNQGADRDVEVRGLGDKLSRLIDERLKKNNVSSANKSDVTGAGLGVFKQTILVIIGIGYGVENLGKDVCPPTPQDTFSDPEEAYQVLSHFDWFQSRQALPRWRKHNGYEKVNQEIKMQR